MKKHIFIITILAVFAGLIFSSYEHGPAYEGGLNRTGSQGGAASCNGSGCHDVNSPATIVAVNVYDAAGGIITHYTPGQQYTVAITGHHTSALSLTKFGFQVSAVQGSGDQAGSFAVTSGANLRVTSLGTLQIVEHKHALEDSVTNWFVARFKWTAPGSGSGDVRFFGILNPFGEGDHKPGHLVKKDDDDDDDDDDEGDSDTTCPNVSPVLTLTEGGGQASAVGGMEAGNVVIWPNPCHDMLNISSSPGGECTVNVYNASGARVYTTAGGGPVSIPVSGFSCGIYQVEITEQSSRIIKSVLKQ